MEFAGIFFGPLAATFFIAVTTLFLLIWHSIRSHQYWKKRNVPYAKPLPLLGNMLQIIFDPQHLVEEKRYKALGRIYGHYEGNRPALSVADPEILRDVFVKDFPQFSNRRTFLSGEEVMDKMVSNLEGEEWKRVRTILTPTFTTGKLKRMIGIFKECSMTLVQNFKLSAEKKEPVNMKKLYGTMAMDVIASAAFSTKIESHSNPENKFVQMAKKAFGTDVSWRFALFILSPSIMRFFKISPFVPSVVDFFQNATTSIIQERKRLGQNRNDFLQLLIDTANEVAKQEEGNEKDEDLANNYGQEVASQKVYLNSVTKNLSMDELVAQCVLFFMAGYDTTASTLSFTTYFLALNPDVQEKARREIHQCLKETNGELTYDAIQNMKYLDNVISETLRHCPPASRLERKAETDYELGNTGITLKKGMMVTVPIYAMHKDPQNFPDPEKFDPDRFTAEERAKRNPYVYMPFGAGPRNCVGMRFALLEVKVCLIHVITHFNIKTCPKTTIPLKFYPGVALLQPKDIFLQMEPRSDSPIN
ncbi:cytochrome P450 3A8 [Parasteatoda tepidariorum]|uniref:cytochrome P450 3A8 n=1 Tax=Parasteatoda tepidariorum TaxID=114398 RepID=UPI00077FA1DE|nr:cytochrome P450 3A8 [Parasteatoda tepidariorum]